jgi:DNA polymerase
VQALCRDLLRDAILRLDEEHEAGREPYIPTMTIHDEIVSEAPQGEGDLGRYEALVAKTEPWAEGIPVKAEGWRGARFQ